MLERMFPSDPDRGAALDRDPVKDRAKRAALRRWRRSQESYARQYAHRMECLADLATAFRDEPDREVILEAAGTARMGQMSTTTQLECARRLRENFPLALRLLKQGVMFVRTAEIFLQVTKNASDDVQHEVGRRLIPEVAEWDAADVSRRVSAMLVEVESELEEQKQRERHERAKANRGMWVLPLQDGMARIGAEVDQVSAAHFAVSFDELDRAQAALDRRDGVVRNAGQRRADLMAELPARVLALTAAIQQGRTEALLTEVTARNAAASGGLVREGSEPQPALRAWDLDLAELQVQLLRVPVAASVTLNAHVPVTTLLELDQRAMQLDVRGAHYLPAFHARALLPTSALRRVLVDHVTGMPIAVEPVVHPPPEAPLELDDLRHSCRCSPSRQASTRRTAADRAERTRVRAVLKQRRRLFAMCTAYVALDEAEPQHDPSAGLRALVHLRDLSCRGVGCTRHARSCDLDHRRDWAKGGQTAIWNLDAESPRCHHSKDGGWVPTRDESTGVMTWTSALGNVYERRPAWDPPPPIRDDARISREIAPPAAPASRDREEEPDRPVRRDPSHVSDRTDPLSYPAADAASHPQQAWGDDGPPPF
jgi:hypothetical protein